MRRLHTIDLKKKYILLCSPDELERLSETNLGDTPIIAAIATENGRIVDLKEVTKIITKQLRES